MGVLSGVLSGVLGVGLDAYGQGSVSVIRGACVMVQWGGASHMDYYATVWIAVCCIVSLGVVWVYV